MANIDVADIEGSSGVKNSLELEKVSSTSIDGSYIKDQAEDLSSDKLKKVLGWPELLAIGVGCIIGNDCTIYF